MQREDRRAAAVDEALPADLDHVGVGQDGQDRLRVRLGQQRLVGQRAVNERCAQLRQDLVLHDLSTATTSCPVYGRRTTSMA